MPEVIIHDDESFERALRRFKKKCEKAGILSDLRKHRHYEKPSERRKRKMNAARRKTRRTRPSGLATRGVHLALAPLAGLLVMTVFAQVGEDPRLLALFLEAPQGALETLVIVNDDFRHRLSLTVKNAKT